MIWQLIRGMQGGLSDLDMAAVLVNFAAVAVVLLLCLPVHEFAHAWAAKKLGDDTAWMHGRLTLNPAKHLDLFGTLMILVVGFGYAKPVPVNPRNFKNYKKGMALTAAAGPLSNLVMAVIFRLIGNLMWLLPVGAPGDLFLLLSGFLEMLFLVNVSLMVFNLIPFPPLDGSRILDLLLPARASMILARYEHIMRWAVFALLLFRSPISWLSGLAARGIAAVVDFPFNLIL
ncbi:MAG: site-2 protease family protein [Oscillospiraceae bacterium]|nr:site-2 protease family protein [Oscillospiraceae bacterium]